jgi:hypothetical protein
VVQRFPVSFPLKIQLLHTIFRGCFMLHMFHAHAKTALQNIDVRDGSRIVAGYDGVHKYSSKWSK